MDRWDYDFSILKRFYIVRSDTDRRFCKIDEEGDRGKIVAIDIETGAFEVAKDSLTASDRLLEKYPDAQIRFVRIGHRAVHRIGSSRSSINIKGIENAVAIGSLA